MWASVACRVLSSGNISALTSTLRVLMDGWGPTPRVCPLQLCPIQHNSFAGWQIAASQQLWLQCTSIKLDSRSVSAGYVSQGLEESHACTGVPQHTREAIPEKQGARWLRRARYRCRGHP